MPQLTKNQRVWIYIEYGKVNNAEELRRRWVGRWPNDRAPTTGIPAHVTSFPELTDTKGC